MRGEWRVGSWSGGVRGGTRDVDAAPRPPVDDFDEGGGGSGRQADESSSLSLLLLLLNVRCTLFKNNRLSVLQYKL